MKKIDYIGNYASRGDINGQSIKTLAVENLMREIGLEVQRYDSSNRPFLSVIQSVINSRLKPHAISLGKKGLLVYLLTSTLTFNIKRERHFFIVGGWFLEYAKHPVIARLLRLFRANSAFYVESKKIAEALNQAGFQTIVFPNFRENAQNLPQLPRKWQSGQPLHLMFLSRLIAEKGVFECIELAKALEKEGMKVRLDIYGTGSTDTQDQVRHICAKEPNIDYKGKVAPECVTDTMLDYNFLVLPSRYQGECMPGVVVEAFSVGLPVITTDWRFLPEMVDHNINGGVFSGKNFAADAKDWISGLTPDFFEQLSLSAKEKFDTTYSLETAKTLIKKHMLKS
tara:strand:- start:645 stop:1664 length:1020 start_codon:yes stop_codon:yes gene_type:complete